MSRACDPSALEYRKDDQEFKVRERLKPGLCEVFSQKKSKVKQNKNESWQCPHLSAAFRKQRQLDRCDFEASLVCTASSSPVSVMQ